MSNNKAQSLSGGHCEQMMEPRDVILDREAGQQQSPAGHLGVDGSWIVAPATI